MLLSMDLNAFSNLLLRGGLRLRWVQRVLGPLVDALGRPALARTVIVGLAVLEVELLGG